MDDEPPRHFLDLDAYGAPPFEALPRAYDEAVTKFGPEKVHQEGTLPWRVAEMHGRLRRTFEQLARPDGPGYAVDNAVFLASVMGHYIGDSYVPFHAVVNYDGQVTGQLGIHSRFESELFSQLRPTLEVAPPLDYRDLEAEHDVEYVRYEHDPIEALLLAKGKRAVRVEAWGELYIHNHLGVHQLHSRRASSAVPVDIVGRDGAIKLYYADHTAELLLFKFSGQK